MRRNVLQTINLIALVMLGLTASAQVKLASLFTSNMVLQQQMNVPIWGWDKTGKNISITTSWNNKTYKGVADVSGKWKIKVSTPVAGGPYTINITDGQLTKLDNVLIGEVWLCGGQSNMEMPMKGFKGQPVLGSNEVILHSKNDKIRLYTVPRSSVTEVQENSKPSEWKVAGPESVSNFSATSYYFGRLLNQMLDIPVGLIHCSYSGSYAEAWLDPDVLKAFPEIKIPAKGDTIKQVSRTPTTLYNGMLHPILGYGIKGAIYYQGESNRDNPENYEKLFPMLVARWRELWGQGEFPFYYAQIAPYDYAQLPPYNKGGKFNSAYLREAQRRSLKTIPNSAMAVLMDIGEQASIHPMRKEPGGTRLAYLALGKTYGLKGFGFASPEYDSMTIKDTSIVVKFVNSPNGMTSYNRPLTQFEIAGKDQKFYPAKAVINGSSVTVSAPEVKQPVAVRYAFRDFIIGELYGTDGLPVSSFRTDDW
ncbi:sialate O-acetylesterase [Mucilaginibacter daejeonensis]|uniref:sialate O-acetylesterase n=1 Tax=Mucilaginibacter daejeonensis TaxID=398049 RepID=UPI001D171B80|nr:sialate O-acetylesterase [Mucilaginibacter daejeonensis]UEG52829.1 sialate O-acetylesterase [Mucilaginibacter daejeonensis]